MSRPAPKVKVFNHIGTTRDSSARIAQRLRFLRELLDRTEALNESNKFIGQQEQVEAALHRAISTLSALV